MEEKSYYERGLYASSVFVYPESPFPLLFALDSIKPKDIHRFAEGILEGTRRKNNQAILCSEILLPLATSYLSSYLSLNKEYSFTFAEYLKVKHEIDSKTILILESHKCLNLKNKKKLVEVFWEIHNTYYEDPLIDLLVVLPREQIRTDYITDPGGRILWEALF